MVQVFVPAVAIALAGIAIFGNQDKILWDGMVGLRWDGMAWSSVSTSSVIVSTAKVVGVSLLYFAAFLKIYNLADEQSTDFRKELYVAMAYAVLAILFTYPLIAAFDTHMLSRAADNYRYLWIIWWGKHTALNLMDPMHTDYVFYPLGTPLIFSTTLPLIAYLCLPLTLAFGVGQAYNLMVLLSIAWAGLGTYKLVNYLTRDERASMIAGMAFAFLPSRMAHLQGHMHVFSNFTLPFFIFHLIKAVREKRRQDIVLASVFFALTAYIGFTQLFFALMFLSLFFVHNLFSDMLKRDLTLSTLKPYAFLAALSIVLTSPLLYLLATEHSLYGVEDFTSESLIHSTDLLAYITPASFNPFLAWLSKDVDRFFTSYISEKTAYAGFTVLLFAVFGAVGGDSFEKKAGYKADWGAVTAFVFAFFVFFLLSLGPFLHIRGNYLSTLWIPMPYSMIKNFSFISMLRTPSRLNIMANFCLIVLSGMGLGYYFRSKNSDKRLYILIAAMVALEFLAVPYPLNDFSYSRGYELLAHMDGETVYTFPETIEDDYYQTIHLKKRIQGFPTGRGSLRAIRHSDEIKRESKDLYFEDFAEKYDIDYFIFKKEIVGNSGDVSDMLDNVFGEPVFEDDRIAIYKIK